MFLNPYSAHCTYCPTIFYRIIVQNANLPKCENVVKFVYYIVYICTPYKLIAINNLFLYC